MTILPSPEPRPAILFAVKGSRSRISVRTFFFEVGTNGIPFPFGPMNMTAKPNETNTIARMQSAYTISIWKVYQISIALCQGDALPTAWRMELYCLNV